MDVKILKALYKDGRKSMREIAKETGLSTPTVSYRIARMLKSGTIRGFIPLLNPEIGGNEVSAFVALRLSGSGTKEAMREISSMKEVVGAYFTTGKENLVLRIRCEDSNHMESLISEKLEKMEGVDVVYTQVIMKIVKDEISLPKVPVGIPIRMKCDYCKGDITSEKPYNLKVGPSYHYFCCKTCRREFINKFGTRIEMLKNEKMH
jgi:Lrp/AsnC family leucine-responsive transcriptional regulator